MRQVSRYVKNRKAGDVIRWAHFKHQVSFVTQASCDPAFLSF